MDGIRTLLAALALAAAVPAWAGRPAAEPSPANEGARAAFFSIPDHPLAYSFSDICDLSIDLRRTPAPRGAADVPLPPGVVAAWASTEKARFAAARQAGTPDAAGNGSGRLFAPAADGRPPFRFADDRPATPAVERPLSFASLPEPSPWMELCGFAIVVLIARRRRAWSALRGLALGHPAPLRSPPRESSR